MIPVTETTVWRLQPSSPLTEDERRIVATAISGFGGANADGHGDFRSYRVAEICAGSLRRSGITSAIHLAAASLDGH